MRVGTPEHLTMWLAHESYGVKLTPSRGKGTSLGLKTVTGTFPKEGSTGELFHWYQ